MKSRFRKEQHQYRRFGLRAAALAVAGLAMLPGFSSADVLCLAASASPVVTRPSTPRIHFELIDESSRGTRQLVARVSVTRETSHAHGLKLNSTLTGLKTMTPARFREFCGKSYVTETELGQMIELDWQLKDELGLDARTTLYDRAQDLSVLSLAGQVNEFVQLVSAELNKRAGLVRGSSVHLSPPNAADLKHDSPMAAALKFISAGPDLERVPVRTATHEYDDASIQKLFAGETLD